MLVLLAASRKDGYQVTGSDNRSSSRARSIFRGRVFKYMWFTCIFGHKARRPRAADKISPRDTYVYVCVCAFAISHLECYMHAAAGREAETIPAPQTSLRSRPLAQSRERGADGRQLNTYNIWQTILCQPCAAGNQSNLYSSTCECCARALSEMKLPTRWENE